MRSINKLFITAFVALGFLLTSIGFVHASQFSASRLVAVGLLSLGRPATHIIEPSTGYIEIFDNDKKQAVYTGKAALININLLKDSKLKITIDNRKSLYSTSRELMFSAVGRAPINLKLKAGAKKSFAYRGSLAIVKDQGGLLAVSHVDIEDYLKSVVPSEIYNRAPDAAQEAQAVAARTYAFRNLDRHKGNDHYQICDTVHCQVYVGIVREIPHASKAVKATEGMVLTYAGSLANTVYHSNCGGYTISNTAAWKGSAISYLVGHYDGIDREEPFCEIGNRIKKNKATGKLPRPQAKLVVKPLALNAKPLKHKNFGHRVGMCQDGAIGMAAIGYSSSKILAFYYPGTQLKTMNYVPDRRIPSDANANIVIASAPKSQLNLEPPLIPPQISALTLNKKMGLPGKNLISTIKEVSSTKHINTAISIRKMFWNPSQPEISRHKAFYN